MTKSRIRVTYLEMLPDVTDFVLDQKLMLWSADVDPDISRSAIVIMSM